MERRGFKGNTGEYCNKEDVVMTVLVFFAFLSGIITILSPCILPVLPIVLSGSVGGKSRPWGIVTGFIVSFTLFTLLLSAVVQALNISSDSLRLVALVILVIFGLTLVIPKMQLGFEKLVSGVSRQKPGRGRRKGFAGGLLVGASLGLVWTPCVGPIMASVISLAVTQTVDGGAVLIALAYSLGTAVPMTAVMLGGRRIISRFPALTAKPQRIQRVFGVLLIAVGLSIGFGLDRKFQGWILEVFPRYGTGLTALENSESIRNALEQRRMAESDESSILGPAPEFLLDGAWLNPEGLPEGVMDDGVLKMEELKGRVVLIDFWTYSCVNCIRTIPYIRSWYDAYSDDGLVVLGIHAPEFAFERSFENLEKAVNDLGVKWPVIQDNQFSQWQAYENRYWPAKYLIDHEGNIRYMHFGEGRYDETEGWIRKLLNEAGYRPGKVSTDIEADEYRSRTPETYLGYRRQEGFNPETGLLKDRQKYYELQDELDNGQWSLEGSWTATGEAVVSDHSGILELQFEAAEVFLVLQPEPGAGIRVLLNGAAAENTADVKDGMLIPDVSRMYHLIKLSESEKARLRLEIDGKARLYAFTFG